VDVEFEEMIDFEWIIDLFRSHNPHVEYDREDYHHFSFKHPEWGIASTAYSDGFIPLAEDRYLKLKEPSFVGKDACNLFSLNIFESSLFPEPRVFHHLHLPEHIAHQKNL